MSPSHHQRATITLMRTSEQQPLSVHQLMGDAEIFPWHSEQWGGLDEGTYWDQGRGRKPSNISWQYGDIYEASGHVGLGSSRGHWWNRIEDRAHRSAPRHFDLAGDQIRQIYSPNRMQRHAGRRRMERQAGELLTAHFPFLNRSNEKHLGQKKMNETIWRNDYTVLVGGKLPRYESVQETSNSWVAVAK